MISCQHLTRRFGNFTAVDDISFDIPKGAICAFLGHNGAGKSTTVNMLTGLLAPTSGEAAVAGISITAAGTERKRKLGVLPANLGLFDDLTVEEHLTLTGDVYGLDREDTRLRTAQLLRVLDLEAGQDVFAAQCSSGMRKKTALAMALLHNPPVLFLDEPFEAIDPIASRTISDLLTTLAGRGTTVFLTSHSLAIVEKMASHFMVIRDGRIVWRATAEERTRPLDEIYFDLVGYRPVEDLAWLGFTRS